MNPGLENLRNLLNEDHRDSKSILWKKAVIYINAFWSMPDKDLYDAAINASRHNLCWVLPTFPGRA